MEAVLPRPAQNAVQIYDWERNDSVTVDSYDLSYIR